MSAQMADGSDSRARYEHASLSLWRCDHDNGRYTASHSPDSSRHHSVYLCANIQGCVICTSVQCFCAIFSTSATEILRAAKILEQMKKAHLSNRGAAGLELEGGGMEMIDAPMIKQVHSSHPI